MNNIPPNFQLNERLAADTYPIVDHADYYLGLNKNAIIPWLVLVPKTQEIELFACEPTFRRRIRHVVDNLAAFSQDYFHADKMNIATLGNVVSQLHIHIIARKTNDFAWPEPIWGKTDFLAYSTTIKNQHTEMIRHFLNTVNQSSIRQS